MGIVTTNTDRRTTPRRRARFAALALLTALLPATLAAAAGPAAALAFSDIPQSSDLYPAVTGLVAKGALDGYPDGSYRPNAPASRAQFVKMLVGALFLEPGAAKPLPFTDIPAPARDTDAGSAFAASTDPDHADNLRLAEVNGILAHIDLEGWDAYAPATRAEAAQIVWNVVGCFG